MNDEDNRYDSMFNSNFIIIQLQLHSNFYYSPTNKDDDISNIFRNNNPALQQTDSTEGVNGDYDDDNPWVLTDGKY